MPGTRGPIPDLAAIRMRYAENYRPVCSGCGQPLECTGYNFFQCTGSYLLGRRRVRCPLRSTWRTPTPQSRADILALCDLIERLTADEFRTTDPG